MAHLPTEWSLDLDSILAEDLVFEEEAGEAQKNRYSTFRNNLPKRTQASYSWPLKLYKEWRTRRKFNQVSKDDEHWPIPSLEDGSLVKKYYFVVNILQVILLPHVHPSILFCIIIRSL